MGIWSVCSLCSLDSVWRSCHFFHQLWAAVCPRAAMPRAKADPTYVEQLKDGVDRGYCQHMCQKSWMTKWYDTMSTHDSLTCFRGTRFTLQILQGFYLSILLEDNYKVDRFHELARRKGVPQVLVAEALQKKKADHSKSFSCRLWSNNGSGISGIIFFLILSPNCFDKL